MYVVGAMRGREIGNRVTDNGVDYFYEEMKKVEKSILDHYTEYMKKVEGKCMEELLVDEEGLSERSRLILRWAVTGETALAEQIDSLKQKTEEAKVVFSETQRREKSCCVVLLCVYLRI